MIGSRAVPFLLCLVITVSSDAAAANKYQITRDPQAIAVAQAAFTAMGGPSAFVGYQDSVALGTLTIYAGGTPVPHSIRMKSKGTHETRVETQMPTGTNTRIMNQGQAAIQKPDGTVQVLASNNLVGARVAHVPLLSLLSEYQNSNISLTYQGTAQVNGHTTSVIAVSYVPSTDPTAGQFFAAVTKTLFYVDQATGLVDKIQYENYEEGNSQQYHRTIEDYFDGYQMVNGIAVPFHQSTYAVGKLEADLILTSVTFNVGLSDSDFTLPQGGQQ